MRFYNTEKKHGCSTEIRIFNLLRTKIMSTEELSEELQIDPDVISNIMIVGAHLGLFNIKIIDNTVYYSVCHSEKTYFDSQTALPNAIMEE